MGKEININIIQNPSTQRESVLWHLYTYGKITSWEAIKEYGITRLSAIIFNLREEGYNIISDPLTKVNRFGNSVNVAVYTYNKKNNNVQSTFNLF
jgi:hypothetical protein